MCENVSWKQYESEMKLSEEGEQRSSCDTMTSTYYFTELSTKFSLLTS